MTAHLKNPLSSSCSLQMTPHWSASFRTVTSLLTDRRLRSWLSGAVLTTWSLTCSKQWRWSWTSGEKGWQNHSVWTPHIQHTLSFNCYHLVDATELWAPERPDTETVSFPKQSISWTLDIKRGTHNTIIQLLIHHILIFSFQICTCHDSCIIVCIVYCFCHFVHFIFVYCSFVVCVLSGHSQSVALWSFCNYNKFLVCVNIPGQ